MSNVTFIIGNGFDLACGLRSRFSDTYDGYIRSTPTVKSDAINQFKEAIDQDIPSWADFEMQLAKYAKKFNSEEELVACLRDYNAYLNDYLVSEQSRFWREYDQIPKADEKILPEMGRSLSHFYYGLTQNDIAEIKKVFDFGSAVNYKFISFNYTDIFDKLMNKTFDKGLMRSFIDKTAIAREMLHIHGVLGSAVTLGIDNDEQILDLPYNLSRRGKRILVKPVFLQAYDRNRFARASYIIDQSNIICIFGWSLGDSDITWRNQLASWLKSSNGHHLIAFKYNYMSKKYHSTAITEKMDDEDDCKDELLTVLFNDSLESESKEDFYTQVHIPVGQSIFNIEKAINDARAIRNKEAHATE